MNDTKKGVGFTIAGGILGASANATIGGIGLTAIGTGVGLGLASMTGIGAIGGLAIYGAYKTFSKSKK